MDLEPLRKAVKLKGGQAALGREIGKKQQTISDWLTKPDRPVPLDDAMRIELATDRTIPAEQIRPDLRKLLREWAKRAEQSQAAA